MNRSREDEHAYAGGSRIASRRSSKNIPNLRAD